MELEWRHVAMAWRLLTAPKSPLIARAERAWSDARDAAEIVNLTLPDPSPPPKTPPPNP